MDYASPLTLTAMAMAAKWSDPASAPARVAQAFPHLLHQAPTEDDARQLVQWMRIEANKEALDVEIWGRQR